MDPVGVVEAEVSVESPIGLESVGVVADVDVLVLDRAPQSFDPDVVEGTPAAAWTPETYDLEDAKARATFVDLAAREAPRAAGEKPRWLLKDPIVDGGNGIEILDAGADALDAAGGLLPDHRTKLAQRYVSDLLLLDGHKFDLRVYVLLASLSPLRAFLCTEGLARFATAPYHDSALRDVTAHLTNYSLNVKGAAYEQHDDPEKLLKERLLREDPDFSLSNGIGA